MNLCLFFRWRYFGSLVFKFDVQSEKIAPRHAPLLHGEPFRQTCARPLNAVVAPGQRFVDDFDQLGRGVERRGNVERIFAERLLDAPTYELRRISVHHPEHDSVAGYPRSLSDYLYRIPVIFECSDERQRVESMVLERHEMGVSQDQVAIEQLDPLPQHKRGDIASAGFDADFFPPPRKPRS